MSDSGLPPAAAGDAPDPEPEIVEAIEQIAEEYLRELQDGRNPDRRKLVAAHPRLGSRLDRRLRLLDLLHGSVGRGSASGSQASEGPPSPSGGPGSSASPLEALFPGLLGPRGDGEAALPELVGRFRVEALVGRGSFGSVYRALDPQLGRRVALKVPRAGYFASREDENRFLREARSAAQLRHPAIVQVFEIAEASGMPCIISEFIDGTNLQERIAGDRPGCRQAAEMVAVVADALEAAHRQRIVHRDVKPGNILLDGAGRPHLADFGLARLEDQTVTVTVEGQLLGTPAYMSPEQALGHHRRVGPESDIYSLGVVLYETLTGERPFRGSRSRVVQQVIHDEPRPPRALNDAVPRDLETICLKAMAKEAARRYPTAGAFADDLRAFLEGRPIAARPVGVLERSWRWSRRNPLTAGLWGAVLALLVTVAVVASTFAVFTAAARNEATRRLSRMNVTAGFRMVRDGDLLASLPWFAEAFGLDRGQPRREAAHRLRLESVLRRSPRVTHAWFLEGRVRIAQLSPDETKILLLGFDQARVETLAGGEPTWKLAHPGMLTTAQWIDDGRSVVTAGINGEVRFWSTSERAQVGEPLPCGRSVVHLAVSPDQRRFAVVLPNHDLRIGDAIERRWIGEPIAVGAPPVQAYFSPDGQRIAVGTSGGFARVWGVATAVEVCPRLTHGGTIVHLSFSPDGERLATASDNGTAQVWDLRSGSKLCPPMVHQNSVHAVRFSPDGRSVLTASHDGTARLWSASSGLPLVEPLVHLLGVPDAVFSDDGATVLSVSYDGTARLWDARTGKHLGSPLPHERALAFAGFGADGRWVVTGSYDGTARIWDLVGDEGSAAVLPHRRGVSCAVFDPTGASLATSSAWGEVKLWDSGTKRPVWARRPFKRWVGTLAFSADGRMLLASSADGTARLLRAESGEPVGEPFVHGGNLLRAALSPDSRWLATAGEDGDVLVWEVDGPRTRPVPLHHPAAVGKVRFSPDGARLLTACHDGVARVWNLRARDEAPREMRHRGRIADAVFSPDGRRIATSSMDETGAVWEVDGPGTPLCKVVHDADLSSIRFSADGRRIVTGSYDGTARIWDAATGAPLTPHLHHDGVVFEAEFSPDGRWVLTASEDQTGQVWDVETGEQLMPPLRHSATVVVARFSPDGRQVVTGDRQGTAKLWTLESSSLRSEECAALTRMVSARKVDATEGLVRISTTEFRELWEKTRERYGRYLEVSPEEAAAWHRRELQRCAAAGLTEAAVRHAGRVLTVYPADDEIRVQRAARLSLLGRHRQAAEEFSRLPAGALETYPNLWGRALCLLAAGDRDGFVRERARVASLLAETGRPGNANAAAWPFALRPRGAPAEMERSLRLIRAAGESAPGDHNFSNTLGALLFRAGQTAEAIDVLRRSMDLADGKEIVWDWAFLALALHQQGENEEAGRYRDLTIGSPEVRGLSSPGTRLATEGPILGWEERIELRDIVEEIEAAFR